MPLWRSQISQRSDPCKNFSKPPILSLEPEDSVCSCGSSLLVQKSKRRKVSTLHIGQFLAQETVLYCPHCKENFLCKELNTFVAPGCNFGYDVIEFIGTAIWCKSKTIEEVRDELKHKNITISEREIAYLAKKFVLYVVRAHEDQQEAICDFLQDRGGYFLHFDSTHPGQGASHLMCAVAEEVSEKSHIVLGSARLVSECKETVVAFLKILKEKYGNPLAGISDMLASNLSAFREVFPGILLLICHFHFLRDLGKDLLSYDNTRLQDILSAYNIDKRLKQFVKDCEEHIAQDPSLKEYLGWEEADYAAFFCQLPDRVAAYFMSLWILNYKQDLHGYGFPFDKATFSYLQRIKKVHEWISKDKKRGELEELYFMLEALLGDSSFNKHMHAMENKVKDFERIRSIMKIAPFFKARGLNEAGEDCDMTLMEAELKEFIESAEIKNSRDIGRQKMVKQILKYWDNLFAKSFQVETSAKGKILVYPQRTNNLMECFFRDFLHTEQKRTGMDTLSRRTQSMIAETPMVKNLSNKDLLKVLLKGEESLAARFAQLDAQSHQRVKCTPEQQKLPSNLRKFIESPFFCRAFKEAHSEFKKAI